MQVLLNILYPSEISSICKYGTHTQKRCVTKSVQYIYLCTAWIPLKPGLLSSKKGRLVIWKRSPEAYVYCKDT